MVRSSLIDPGRLAELQKAIHERPKETFANLRLKKPILVEGSFAVVTRYDDVKEVLGNHKCFLVPYEESFRKLLEGRNFFLGMQDSPEYRQDVENMRKVVRKDDPEKRIAPFVQRTARELVSAAPGRLEVVGFAAKVAMAWVYDYFGMPAPSPEVAKQSGVMLSYLFLQASNLENEAVNAAKALRQSLQQSLDTRKKDRGKHDDVLERCLELQDKRTPGMEDDARIIDNLFSLIVAALPTTMAFVARATDELLRLPAKDLADARQAALKGIDAVTPYALEAVRLNAMGPGVFRTTAEACIVAKGTSRETTIPKGARVLVALQSAMLDENKFDNPDDFRIGRDLSEYLPFGYGLHTCFGEHINRVLLPLIVQALLRLKNLRRAPGADGELQLEGPSPKSLWVEFDP